MGNNHIAIPALLKIGPGALGELGTYLKDLRMEKVVILFGNGLIEMFGMDVMKSLAEMGIDVLEYQELDTVRLEDLTSLAFSMPAKTQAVMYWWRKSHRCSEVLWFFAEPGVYQHSDICIERWFFQRKCFSFG